MNKMIITKYIEDILEKKWRHFTPKELPEGLDRYELWNCYDASVMTVLRNQDKKLFYCEWIATVTRTGERYLHAWVSDGEYAYDPTWRVELQGEVVSSRGHIEYFGIMMWKQEVWEFMLDTNHKAILANRNKNKELADIAINSGKDILLQ